MGLPGSARASPQDPRPEGQRCDRGRTRVGPRDDAVSTREHASSPAHGPGPAPRPRFAPALRAPDPQRPACQTDTWGPVPPPGPSQGPRRGVAMAPALLLTGTQEGELHLWGARDPSHGSCAPGSPAAASTAEIPLRQTAPRGWSRSAGTPIPSPQRGPGCSSCSLPLPAPSALPPEGYHSHPRERIRGVNSINVQGLLSPSPSRFPGSSGTPHPELGLWQELVTGRAARRGNAEVCVLAAALSPSAIISS